MPRFVCCPRRYSRGPRRARWLSEQQAHARAQIAEQWAATAWAQKLATRAKRATLTDFDRFRVMVLRKKVGWCMYVEMPLLECVSHSVGSATAGGAREQGRKDRQDGRCGQAEEDQGNQGSEEVSAGMACPGAALNQAWFFLVHVRNSARPRHTLRRLVSLPVKQHVCAGLNGGRRHTHHAPAWGIVVEKVPVPPIVGLGQRRVVTVHLRPIVANDAKQIVHAATVLPKVSSGNLNRAFETSSARSEAICRKVETTCRECDAVVASLRADAVETHELDGQYVGQVDQLRMLIHLGAALACAAVHIVHLMTGTVAANQFLQGQGRILATCCGRNGAQLRWQKHLIEIANGIVLIIQGDGEEFGGEYVILLLYGLAHEQVFKKHLVALLGKLGTYLSI
jgi:hypothetical protein